MDIFNMIIGSITGGFSVIVSIMFLMLFGKFLTPKVTMRPLSVAHDDEADQITHTTFRFTNTGLAGVTLGKITIQYLDDGGIRGSCDHLLLEYFQPGEAKDIELPLNPLTGLTAQHKLKLEARSTTGNPHKSKPVILSSIPTERKALEA